MGQSHLQGNRKAILEIQIVFLLLLQQCCVMLKSHPGFILGLAWLNWWQMSPVNSLFVTYFVTSKASAMTWALLPSAVPSVPRAKPAVLILAGGFCTPFPSDLASCPFSRGREEKLLA